MCVCVCVCECVVKCTLVRAPTCMQEQAAGLPGVMQLESKRSSFGSSSPAITAFRINSSASLADLLGGAVGRAVGGTASKTKDKS